MISDGMQCTCTSLAFFCFTADSISPSVKPTSSDVDRLLYEGTIILNQFGGKPRYLLIDELPCDSVVLGKHYTLRRLDVASGLIGTDVTVSDSRLTRYN